MILLKNNTIKYIRNCSYNNSLNKHFSKLFSGIILCLVIKIIPYFVSIKFFHTNKHRNDKSTLKIIIIQSRKREKLSKVF